jgi:hypothetical protein
VRSGGALETPIAKAFAQRLDGTFSHFQGLGSPLVGPSRAFRPFIDLQQDAGAGQLTGGTLPSANAFEKVLALLSSQLNSIFFGWHGVWRDMS